VRWETRALGFSVLCLLTSVLCLLTSVLCLAGCNTLAVSTTALPGVYRGTLPCADCAGIETTLTLRRDGTFTLSRQYQGREMFTAPLETGRWRRREGVIELFPRAPAPATADERLCFGLTDSGTLLQYDIGCAPIEGLAGTLGRAAGPATK
jgi:hypothetical protein